jgi:transcriptional regulator with XRE-family HTH domain
MLNEALRLMRAYHDISQTQLCSELGVSNSYLSEIESGKKSPSLELLKKYGERFDVPVSSLLFFSENLDSQKITDKVRVGVARKMVSILQWVEQRNQRNFSGS